jgi:hypothetical protein
MKLNQLMQAVNRVSQEIIKVMTTVNEQGSLSEKEILKLFINSLDYISA